MADPLLQSYLQITEETDRIMGLSEPPAPPVAAPAPAPAPVAVLSAAAAPARRRAQRRKRPRALGPGRREKLASLVARQRAEGLDRSQFRNGLADGFAATDELADAPNS